MLLWADGELIPLTLVDWDVEAGTICLVVQGVGTSSIEVNKMAVGDAFAGIPEPLGRLSEITAYPADQTVVFTAGGLGLPPVYPIMREHLRAGNQVTIVAGLRSAGLLFWTGEDERVAALRREFGAVGLEAAHVRWCNSGGPNSLDNGIHSGVQRPRDGQPRGRRRPRPLRLQSSQEPAQ